MFASPSLLLELLLPLVFLVNEEVLGVEADQDCEVEHEKRVFEVKNYWQDLCRGAGGWDAIGEAEYEEQDVKKVERVEVPAHFLTHRTRRVVLQILQKRRERAQAGVLAQQTQQENNFQTHPGDHGKDGNSKDLYKRRYQM